MIAGSERPRLDLSKVPEHLRMREATKVRVVKGFTELLLGCCVEVEIP